MENEKLIATSKLYDIGKRKKRMLIIGAALIAAAIAVFFIGMLLECSEAKRTARGTMKYYYGIRDNVRYGHDKSACYDECYEAILKDLWISSILEAGAEKYGIKNLKYSKDIPLAHAYITTLIEDEDYLPKAWAEKHREYYINVGSLAYYRPIVFISYLMLVGGIGTIIAGIIYKIKYGKTGVAVTDKRIYGNKNWGRDVQIAMSQVNSVSSRGKNGLVINTSGGNVKFTHIQNRDEIVSAISECFVKR